MQCLVGTRRGQGNLETDAPHLGPFGTLKVCERLRQLTASYKLPEYVGFHFSLRWVSIFDSISYDCLT